MLSQALTQNRCEHVAWSGPEGATHYRMSEMCTPELAGLAQLARSDLELLHLATSWWEAQSDRSVTLVIVFRDAPPSLLEGLLKLQRQGKQIIAILLDEERHFAASAPLDSGTGQGLAGYLQAWNLFCTPPLECTSLSELSSWLQRCWESPGVRFFHILGARQDHDGSDRLAYSSFTWKRYSRGRTRQEKGSLTLETATIERLVPELLHHEGNVCLWARHSHPGPLTELGQRLHPCSTSGLMLQALGLIAQGLHPIVFLTARQIPEILPDLLELDDCPITFVLTNACSNVYELPDYTLPHALLSDLSLLRNVPRLCLAVPADEEEGRHIFRALLDYPHPSVLRLTTAPACSLPRRDLEAPLPIGKGRQLGNGEDLSLICLGPTAYVALLSAETLRSWGINAAIYDMRFLAPLDLDMLHKAAASRRLITVEEHSIHGGLGTAVLEAIAEQSFSNAPTGITAVKMGLDCDFLDCAPEDHGISLNGVLEAAKKVMGLV